MTVAAVVLAGLAFLFLAAIGLGKYLRAHVERTTTPAPPKDTP